MNELYDVKREIPSLMLVEEGAEAMKLFKRRFIDLMSLCLSLVIELLIMLECTVTV